MDPGLPPPAVPSKPAPVPGYLTRMPDPHARTPRPDPDDAARYEALHADRLEDLAFYVDEARRSGGPVLEAGCGTGRVALGVARAGVTAFGFDADAGRVARAERARRILPPEAGARAGFFVADMREVAVEAVFARVFVPFRGLQHLLGTADQLAALGAARAALADGGRLVFDVFEPDPDLLADAAEGPTPLEPTGREIASPDGSKVVEAFSRRYDPVEQRMLQTFVYERTDPRGRVVAHAYEPIAIRVLFRFEIEHLLARAGYEVEELYGGWDRRPYDAPGEDLVWIAAPTG